MSTPRRALAWLELTPDYHCNQRCLGCYAVQEQGPSMTPRELAGLLVEGRRQGARSLWLGGGEPTLRRDLLATVRAARKAGYDRVVLQTNAMLLAYPDAVTRLVDAGLTDVRVALKGHDASTHDRWTGTPGAFDLCVRALENLARTALPVEADVLVYASSMARLPELVRAFLPRGVRRFHLWLLTAAPDAPPEVTRELPRVRDLVPYLEAARAVEPSRPDLVTVLHTAPCTLPASLRGCLVRASDWGMLVANPGGYTFRLEDSPMEGGRYLPGCARCALRGACAGAREDYLGAFGDEEFAPV
ncbi:MAG: radical SAM protein [Deltaproteobacteria bacterium]|nr:radical SAM protein [Deltaproteobacteria bacterium]